MTDTTDAEQLRDTIAEWARKLYNLSSDHSTEEAETYESVLLALNRELDRLAELAHDYHFEERARMEAQAYIGQLQAALAAAEARATAAEELEERLEAANTRFELTHQWLNDAKTQLAQAQAALAKYGRHQEGCEFLGVVDLPKSFHTVQVLRERYGSCTCGLDVARVAIEETKP